MQENRRGSLLKWPLVTLSLVPVSLFAYLGHFSRLIADDYCHLAWGKEFGAWGTVLYARGSWNGSYTNYFLPGLLTPLDVVIPAVLPPLTVVLWIVGLIWLGMLMLTRLGVKGNRLAIVFALSSLLVAATINGLHSSQSYLWLAANVAYTLPMVILVFYVSLVIQVASRPKMRISIGAFSIIGALICFANAGFSAMYLVFQGTVLTGWLVGLTIFVAKTVRRPYMILIGAGWIATVASAVVQITAPGTSLRMHSPVEARFGTPVRYLPDLVEQTLGVTFEHIGNQDAFAGFMLLFAAAMFVTLTIYKARNPLKIGASPTLKSQPLWVGMIIQLPFMPVLWTHTSDSPQILDSFNSAYFVVIFVNIVLIIAFAMLLFYRAKIDEWFRRHNSAWHIYIAIILLAMVALFALTQLRSIHYKAATYLFTSAVVFLFIGGLQLSDFGMDAQSKRLWQFPSSHLPFY